MTKQDINHDTSIRLYSLAPFDRSGKVRWLLEELGVAYEDVWLDPKKKQNETPEFLRLNPMGQVPVAEINGAPVFESGALCAYFADQFIEKGLAPKLSAPSRALYQQWMYFSSATIESIQTRIMIIEDIPGGPVREEKQKALLTDLQSALLTLDMTLSKNSYLVENRFSAADICVGYHFYFLPMWPELAEIINPFRDVTSYLQRLRERPAAVKSKVFSYEG